MSKLSVVHAPINSLTPGDFNVNVVSPDNEAKIDASLKRIGFFKPLLARELENGKLQIIGGEHRWLSAKRLGHKEVPVINLGKIDDQRAKEIGLLDNSRFGSDDTLQLAELLEGMGSSDELATFMPFSESDIASIFSSVTIALDDLNLSDEDGESPSLPKERPVQTHQIMRFRIPVEDCVWIQHLVEHTMKFQKLTESDSLTNAGDALVRLLKKTEE
jgi:ParB-like chromosome segregation protein Spo0J